MYAGAAINPTALRAANNTSGKVLHFNGRLLRAYYSSTCGGRAASARDIWPTGPGFEFNLVAPIQATERVCACEASPLHRWTVKRSRGEAAKRIGAYGAAQGMAIRSITTVKSITPERTGANGRPSRYRVTDDQGKWWSLTAEDMRRALNTPRLACPRSRDAHPQRRLRSQSDRRHARAHRPRVRPRRRHVPVRRAGLPLRGESAEQIVRRFYPGAVVTSAY